MSDNTELLPAKVYTVTYESDGKKYSMQIRGTYQEIYMHCVRLGFKYDGELVMEIPA